MSREEAVETIKSLPGIGGQISRPMLRKLIAPLSPGRYVLVRPTKRPKRARAREELRSLLGGKLFKMGRIKVFPSDRAGCLRAYLYYLRTLEFVIN